MCLAHIQKYNRPNVSYSWAFLEKSFSSYHPAVLNAGFLSQMQDRLILVNAVVHPENLTDCIAVGSL